ncbi:UDP-N-acetylmuramoylalanyl-D-glutamyl-2,6-diaminopimelate-D-alanyl-D-alanine ligase [Geomicrobium sp. JCM 19037]|uniref:UDP-N-acetylmuramoyl-tripeptide--D-alanyl-D- alanine ligase n=1 Tax=Geomicrobium sp. JCM 19037 TaxID=1460634 RepID=UPI00045F140B|nr:UDP-N-acetylmuramoyl-tripeptide--D-alanyl-D-alanine ligase [Geomicrobium sp. JCM 19037]GAK05524.1 UDP-N-acetylmuramoylalanyl-D-glutamyl-2,6-diaminopimelate-D-alanyl-D-alanine ligase [Geomicrobium sp. JCM 19037]
MESLLILLLAIAWALYTIIRVKRNVHMLQLNSYRNERYFRWMKGNTKKAFRLWDLLPLLSLIALPLSENISFYVIAAWAIIVFASLTALRPQTEEKKKLVYTSRVKRLLTAIGLVYLLIFLGAFWWSAGGTFTMGLFIAILAVATFLAYFIVMVANVITMPIELQINQYYFHDAERIVRDMPNLEVIGVTGSYGKTSTKHILKAVLASKYNVLMTPESYNTKMGVTRTIREQLKPYHDLFIAEMGAKQEHDIEEICTLVNQKYGIVTAIGEQHLETFKTLETIKKTKFELVETLPHDGTAFLNKDDDNIRAYPQVNSVRTMYYGIDAEDLHYRATNITYSGKGTTFTVEKYDGTSVEIQTKLLGRHNIYNILAAVAIGAEKNIPLDVIARAIKGVAPVAHRLELKRTSDTLTIIDDSFNSNPSGSKMAVEVLGYMPEKKILITPGMIELGDREYELNKRLATHAADVCDYIILVGKKQTIPLQDGLQEAGYSEDKYYVASNLQDALAKMRDVTATEPSVVLLENDLPDTFEE